MAKKRNRITAAMSKTIGETSPLIKKVKVTAEDNNVNEVYMNALEVNPFQPRIQINLHNLNELISSIEQNGLLQPIIVTEKKENGLYTIIAGHRRYEAYKIMGKEHIKATILKNITNRELAILSLTENLIRENLHPIENAIAIKNILENNIVESQNKLAQYVGLSKGYISKLMNILKLPSNILKTIKEENYTDINVLVLINKIDTEKEMFEAYNSIKTMNRVEALKYLKNEYFSNKKYTDTVLIRNSKDNIKIDIDISKLSFKQSTEIKEKIKEMNEEILYLFSKWETLNNE